MAEQPTANSVVELPADRIRKLDGAQIFQAVGGEADRIAALLDDFAKNLDQYQDTYEAETVLMRDAASLLRSQALEIQKVQAENKQLHDLLLDHEQAALAAGALSTEIPEKNNA